MHDIDELKIELENLVKLQEDLEKQMIKFDEIIPYERQNTAKIFSPRLLNMMLACGPQIESVTKLIAKRCQINLNDVIDDSGSTMSKSIPKLIHEINSKSVLSKFEIITRLHKLQFTPFTLHLEWWKKYNDLKHGLSTKQFDINYAIVMDALAGLSGLHCLAEKIISVSDEKIDQVLEPKNWIKPEIFIFKDVNYQLETWKSLLFRIDVVCNI